MLQHRIARSRAEQSYIQYSGAERMKHETHRVACHVLAVFSPGEAILAAETTRGELTVLPSHSDLCSSQISNRKTSETTTR